MVLSDDEAVWPEDGEVVYDVDEGPNENEAVEYGQGDEEIQELEIVEHGRAGKVGPRPGREDKGKAKAVEVDYSALCEGIEMDDYVFSDGIEAIDPPLPPSSRPATIQTKLSFGKRMPTPPPAYNDVAILPPSSARFIRPSTTTTNASSSVLKRPSTQPTPSSSSTKGELKYPWSTEALSVLSKRFRLKAFRSKQLEAINGTLAGKDVFVLMPTGGGKSLCYQLPSQVTRGKTSGVTIVVSPLISLIQDQVAHLHAIGIAAIAFTGDLPAAEKKRAITFLNGGESGMESVDGGIVYVTPEMLGKSAQFQSLLRSIYRRGKLARFVIDEAHCVSSVSLVCLVSRRSFLFYELE